MKYKKIILTASFLFGLGLSLVSSQEVKEFSLREAQIYALEHNYDVVNAITDIEIARERVKETVATGLPQISGSVSYNDYLEIPTQLIPGEFFEQEPGTFIPVQFGTQHNATLSGQVNQMIFNGQYIVGLQASQAYLSLSETSYEKSQIEIKNMIATAYYPVIILQENQTVFDSMLVTLENMLYETREYYNAGFVEDSDVDQLELLKADMQTTLTNIENQLEISRNTLKYLMGLPADQEIVLTDKLNDLMMDVNREILMQKEFDFENHIDYIMLDRQENLADLQVKLSRTEYYPMLNAFYTYQRNAQRNEFNFFTSNEKWYPTQILGLQLDIPIWSSGNRYHKVQQKKLELEKIHVQQEQLKQGLSLRVRTVRSEFNNAYLVYQNKERALANAQRIYEKMRTKYKEGISTSLDLSQTYNQYLNSQIDHLTSMQTLLMKKAELEKELTKSEY
ncbi:MAG: TolC family protein [Bacteroidales bacterium]|nr:TolC family protein [Bacteroidales bacterium]